GATAPSFGHVVIRYRRQSPGEAESARIAAELRGAAQVELRPARNPYRVPTVLYFRPEDRDAALALAQFLGGDGPAWSVRAGQARSKIGSLEAWIP
ncbi:MAG TPA: hypothetical protein VE650_10250, partial [Acetobacteraceae bacterium]|nr:hypothetical protein [Acetobacteraceae bacterium]